MRKRTVPILLAVLLIILAIVAAVLLRRRAAPEPARLLPNADAFVYINLKPLRMANIIGQSAPVPKDPEYLDFVRETGFQFERDLDEAAFAVHLPISKTDGRFGDGQQHTRFSEIFVGRIDTGRAATYLRKISRTVENYNDVDIYNIALEGRTVRVALLGVGAAAASNTDSPEVIHGMIDRYRKIALPFGGPTLVRDYYRHLPFGTLAWSIARIAPSTRGGTNGMFVLPGGFDLFFPANTVIVTSVRYTGAVQLKAEAFAPSEDAARRITEQAGAFLAIFRGIQSGSQLGGTDPDVKAFFDSLSIVETKNRAILTATVPPGFLKKMFSEPPANQLPGLEDKKTEQKSRDSQK